MSSEPLLSAREYYEKYIAPNNAQKDFQVPAWAISFAEKYADYMGLAYHKLMLQISVDSADISFMNLLKKIEGQRNSQP